MPGKMPTKKPHRLADVLIHSLMKGVSLSKSCDSAVLAIEIKLKANTERKENEGLCFNWKFYFNVCVCVYVVYIVMVRII